jgi:hypothetical protein
MYGKRIHYKKLIQTNEWPQASTFRHFFCCIQKKLIFYFIKPNKALPLQPQTKKMPL